MSGNVPHGHENMAADCLPPLILMRAVAAFGRKRLKCPLSSVAQGWLMKGRMGVWKPPLPGPSKKVVCMLLCVNQLPKATFFH